MSKDLTVILIANDVDFDDFDSFLFTDRSDFSWATEASSSGEADWLLL